MKNLDCAQNMAFKYYACVLLVIFTVTVEIRSLVAARLPRIQHPADGGSLAVMVVGDWGRRGKFNQSQVAYQMGVSAEKMNLDFVISTGDNFYPSGLTHVNDPAFDQSFTDVYTAPSLQRQWYSVLGNHDYRGDALAQLSPVLSHKDSKWFCLKSFIVNTEVADFVFIDTTPFENKYFTDPEDHVYDWRGVLPRDKYISDLLKDLELALVESQARWKIVIGHHTIKSAGFHGNTQELVQKILPILKENEVDLYVNGHDHCLEHISSSDSPIQFLTSGGGSKSWRGAYNWSNPNELKFYYDGQGFLTLEITQHEIEIRFYDILGHVLHKWSASKSLVSSI